MAVHENDNTDARVLSTWTFQQIEHGLYVALAVLLCLTVLLALGGAAFTLWTGLSDWAGTESVFTVIERLLVVLMLIEILHTVHVSVRSGALTCEPFLVVGLIASIRRVLVITLETSQVNEPGKWTPEVHEMLNQTMIELSVLGMLILIMVVSIFILRRSDRRAVQR